MRVLIVYESVMGNTRVIAEAVAQGARAAGPKASVRCVPAARVLAEPLDADLVIVGAPTHFFGLPGERSRRMWVDDVLRRGREGGLITRLEPGATGPGLREWFDELATAGDAEAAAFDTRLHRPMAPCAARRIAHLLRRHGFRVIARPEGFIVKTVDGPLRAGERERAVAWGSRLVARAGLVAPRRA